jgi:hypothetical protein
MWHDRDDVHAILLGQQLIVIVLKDLQIKKPRKQNQEDAGDKHAGDRESNLEQI